MISIWIASDAPHSEHWVVDDSRLRLIASSSFSTRARFGNYFCGIDRFIFESPDVPGPPLTVFTPKRIPIGAVRALRASFLAAADRLLPEPHLGAWSAFEPHASILESGPGENEEAPKIVLVHLADSLENVAINRHLSAPQPGTGMKTPTSGEHPGQGHQATSSDTNNGRAAVRRSTSVQPTGGVTRPACSSHIG